MMFKRTLVSLAVLNMFAASCNAKADEINVGAKDNVETAISIYNNNLALIKDTRLVDLKIGVSELAFEGVASEIKPETAMLEGENISVIEQNYEYDLLTGANLLEQSIGENVKTVVMNPASGKLMFDKAEILNSSYGNPVLKFSYGIETNFPGRIVYEKVPENLRVKPTLVVKLDNKVAGSKNLELDYLTNGLSWKADYVALVENNEELKLNGWVTLNNTSGSDYKEAKIQLIAGDVKQIDNFVRPVPRMMMAKGAANMDMAEVAPAGMSAQNFSEYYLYNLPVQTTLLNKQSKQVSLMSKDKVTYERQYVLQSPLYIGMNNNENEFEKQNPDLAYKIANNEETGLGLPLPEGDIRFYENDADGNLQFIGASTFEQLAKGEDAELKIGKAFDVSAKGKVVVAKELSKDVYEAEAEVEFNNAKNENVKVKFEQGFNGNLEILEENVKSEGLRAGVRTWMVEIPKNGSFVLKFKVRLG